MNLPLSLPSPPLWAGERVAEGRERGIRTGSWSQCTANMTKGLPMNRQVVARASRPCEHADGHTGETPVPLFRRTRFRGSMREFFRGNLSPAAKAILVH